MARIYLEKFYFPLHVRFIEGDLYTPELTNEEVIEYLPFIQNCMNSTVKISVESDITINSELERLEKMFADTDVSFNEYDDVIVRRLIECIRVLKENKIIVILKGGFQAEENLI